MKVCENKGRMAVQYADLSTKYGKICEWVDMSDGVRSIVADDAGSVRASAG